MVNMLKSVFFLEISPYMHANIFIMAVVLHF